MAINYVNNKENSVSNQNADISNKQGRQVC